ncbi:hypothetical protein AVEN_80750-1, partial [Araneus ventricosus]
ACLYLAITRQACIPIPAVFAAFAIIEYVLDDIPPLILRSVDKNARN